MTLNKQQQQLASHRLFCLIGDSKFYLLGRGGDCPS